MDIPDPQIPIDLYPINTSDGFGGSEEDLFCMDVDVEKIRSGSRMKESRFTSGRGNLDPTRPKNRRKVFRFGKVTEAKKAMSREKLAELAVLDLKRSKRFGQGGKLLEIIFSRVGKYSEEDAKLTMAHKRGIPLIQASMDEYGREEVQAKRLEDYAINTRE